MFALLNNSQLPLEDNDHLERAKEIMNSLLKAQGIEAEAPLQTYYS